LILWFFGEHRRAAGEERPVLAAGDFTYSVLRSGQTGSFGLESGALTFTVIPEPSTTLLALLGSLLTLRRHRTRKP
jgi:hypothetical protein